MDDRAVVERQLGRAPRAFRRVVLRCPFGAAAVTEQAPSAPPGAPSPPTYSLPCRHLVAAVSRLEAAGGIERWSGAIAQDAKLADSLAEATEEQRAVRRELAAGRVGQEGGASLGLGIAGSSRPQNLKCPDAHAALRPV